MLAALALAAGVHGRTTEGSFHSQALGGTLPFTVYLPPGYATSHRRYPVIYFLHGLPASPYAYRGIGFITRALDALGRPAIVIAPRGARDGDSDPEYLDWGTGRNWETAIAQELPPDIQGAWKHALDAVGRFYERALTTGEPGPVPSLRGLLLAGVSAEAPPAEELMGPYLEWSRLLGEVTAAAHLELADLLTEEGKKADAVVHLRLAVELNPADEAARKRLKQAQAATETSPGEKKR